MSLWTWPERLALGWSRFWFESNGAAQMRVFRGALGGVLFLAYIVRSLDLDFFYSDQGLVKSWVVGDLMPMQYRFSLFQLFPGHTALWVLNGIFLASLLTLALGIWPRLSAFVALILHLSFLHRDMAVTIGVDMIATLYLFYLCFADYRTHRPKSDFRAMVGSMAYRLCQVQLCVIYGYSGLQKLKGIAWWQGEGVWRALANPQVARWDFTWAAHFPMTLTLLSFISLFWEIYFPALVWVKPARYPVLIFGILFHLGIGIFINIPLFAALMMTTYLLFVDSTHLDRFGNTLLSSLKFVQVRTRTAE